ncbi:MAG: hypothetical protein ACLSA6_04725 [Holdemania massiliensis]
MRLEAVDDRPDQSDVASYLFGPVRRLLGLMQKVEEFLLIIHEIGAVTSRMIMPSPG